MDNRSIFLFGSPTRFYANQDRSIVAFDASHDWEQAADAHKSYFPRVGLADSMKPLVFVSCGQHTQNEKAVGNRIVELISAHTGYATYLAEDQRTFEGLSTSILTALLKMSGMVVVMHKRGEVSTSRGSFERGSLWIEQEIAIAAALKQAGRDIPVAAYIEDGIKREGLRGFLQLNALTFTNEDEVIADFERTLTNGRFNLFARPHKAVSRRRTDLTLRSSSLRQ